MDTRSKSRRANSFQISVMGAGLVCLALLLAGLLVALWPHYYPKFPPPGVLGDPDVQCLAGWCPGPDARLLVMVMAAGGLGSIVHVAKSFSDFVGNERFMTSWIWWYVLKPFIGMIVAMLLYLFIRGGFLTVSATGDETNVNLHGLMGMAVLAGMFAKQATDKLGEVFDTLFRTRRAASDAKRKDVLENPVAYIIEAQPPIAGPHATYICLRGVGFARGVRVQVNGTGRETTLADSTRLAFQLLPGDVAQAGVLNVQVVNPPPGGGPSAPLMLAVDGSAAAVDDATVVPLRAPAPIEEEMAIYDHR
ncbi:hypothetical protein LNN38_13495 [Pseudomonas sp. LA21]|uniref:hypothetical protein n=1 Tax=unclassified Pseudomonas TaxID=196821 RepID=UPI001FB77198|nr:hypothetical protein [Pseudomonas sp. LA21]MCJ1885863.1 hypothetical protein [Pseudomonas sp. LA21]